MAVARYYLTQKRSQYDSASFTGQDGLGETTVATLINALPALTTTPTFADQPALFLTPTLDDVWNCDVRARLAAFQLDNSSYCQLALRDSSGGILILIEINASGSVVVSDTSGMLETVVVGVLSGPNNWLRLAMTQGILSAYYGLGALDATVWTPILVSPLTLPADPNTFHTATLSLLGLVSSVDPFYVQWANVSVSPT